MLIFFMFASKFINLIGLAWKFALKDYSIPWITVLSWNIKLTVIMLMLIVVACLF